MVEPARMLVLVLLLALALLSAGCSQATLLAPRLQPDDIGGIRISLVEGDEVQLGEVAQAEWIERLADAYQGSWERGETGFEITSPGVMLVGLENDWGRDVTLRWYGGPVEQGAVRVGYRGGNYHVRGEHPLTRAVAGLEADVKAGSVGGP